MQTIDQKINCIGSRKTCRYWKNLGTSDLGDYWFLGVLFFTSVLNVLLLMLSLKKTSSYVFHTLAIILTWILYNTVLCV